MKLQNRIKTVFRVALACCLTTALPSLAGTWWVDAASTAETPDGSEVAPFKTIQDGVNAAEASEEETLVVKVKPGVYDSGEYLEQTFKAGMCRVLISKRLTLESTDGKENTIIVGKEGSGQYGLGDGAVRCICADGNNAENSTIVGFTFRNGATKTGSESPRKEGGGAVCYNGTSGYVIVKDCTAVDCQANYGGAFKSVTLIRTLVRRCHNDNASSKGAAANACRAYCCIFESCGQPDSNAEYILAGDGPYVNCSAIANNGCLCRSSSSQRSYNFVSLLATRQEFENTKTGGDYVIMTYGNGADGYTHGTQVSLDSSEASAVFVSTLGGDYRPVKGGKADGYADPQYCKLDWIPEVDRNRDFLGGEFDIEGAAGTIDCGAIQGAVEIMGGAVKFPRVVKTAASSTVTLPYSAQAESWPEQCWICSDACVVTFDSAIPPRFPSAKGGFYLTIPPAGKTVTATEHMRTATLSVGDGQAYSTIQAAIDAAGSSASDYTVITVAPGTYEPIVIGEKNVVLRSTEGKGATFINGVKDAETPSYAGCGPLAQRCVTVNPGSCFVGIEGFTLKNGATQVWNSESGDVQGAWSGGAFNAPEGSGVQLCDCTLEDCVGWKGAAAWGGWLQRCVIKRCDNPDQSHVDSVVRASTLSSCVMTECRTGNQLLTAGAKAFSSTIVARRNGLNQAVASKSSYLYGSIVCGGKHEKAASVSGSVFYDYVGAMSVASGFTSAHALVANVFDGPFGVLSGSPAIGCWKISAPGNDIWPYLIDDLDGNPIEVTDDKLTAGAVWTRYEPREITLEAGVCLAEAMMTVCCGDTIHVPAGEYATGRVEQDHSWSGSEATSFTVGARVSVPAAAVLIGAGSSQTTIRGGEKIRCVCLATNSSLRAFSLVGGISETSSGKGEDGWAGGILADRSAVIEDCVIMGNRAYQNAATSGGSFRRCTFRENYARGSTSVGSVRSLENCLASGNCGSPILADYELIVNSTFLYDNTNTESRIGSFGTYKSGARICNSALILSPTGVDTQVPSLYNCLLPTIGANSWRWKPESTQDCLLNEISFDSDWNGIPTSDFVGMDRGNNLYVPSGSDISGAQRVQNATVDIGAYEYDWMPTYSALFSRRAWADVVETSGALTSASTGINFGADATLSAVIKTDPGKEVSINATVASGSLIVKVNGEERGSLTSENGKLLLGRLSVNDRIDLAFAESTGSAFLSGLRGVSGLILMVR